MNSASGGKKFTSEQMPKLAEQYHALSEADQGYYEDLGKMATHAGVSGANPFGDKANRPTTIARQDVGALVPYSMTDDLEVKLQTLNRELALHSRTESQKEKELQDRLVAFKFDNTQHNDMFEEWPSMVSSQAHFPSSLPTVDLHLPGDAAAQASFVLVLCLFLLWLSYQTQGCA
jgi:hypothetical protein